MVDDLQLGDLNEDGWLVVAEQVKNRVTAGGGGGGCLPQCAPTPFDSLNGVTVSALLPPMLVGSLHELNFR